MCRLGRMFFEDGMTLNNKICPAEKYRATRTREAPLCGAVNHVTNALCMACGHIFFNDKIIDYAGDLHNVKLPREVPKLSIGDHVVVEEAKNRGELSIYYPAEITGKATPHGSHYYIHYFPGSKVKRKTQRVSRKKIIGKVLRKEDSVEKWIFPDLPNFSKKLNLVQFLLIMKMKF
eukprot:TRINITY_DN1093_c0_g1_i2.p1 TRINITY_DN1093_c0_g1~~TRINITY_DN1093_c0_g1_i2.p1  ORF type:complete len:176 (-),score=34.37 TRINITY_DN1093_c0_g1_i2:133-660(-)